MSLAVIIYAAVTVMLIGTFAVEHRCAKRFEENKDVNPS